MQRKTRNRPELTVAAALLVISVVVTPGRAEFAFGKPVNPGAPINTARDDYGFCISADGLELYITSDRPPSAYFDVWVATRATVQDPWGEPVLLGPEINSAREEWHPTLSWDGLELYFSSNRPGGLGIRDIYVARRENRNSPWGPAENLGAPINSSKEDYTVHLCQDGLELYFSSSQVDREPKYGWPDLYVARRATTDDEWGVPENLGPQVNDSSTSIAPSLTADGRYLFFSDLHAGNFRSGGLGGPDIWVASREAATGAWSTPVNLGPPINSASYEALPRIAPDGLSLSFCSTRSGGLGSMDIWQAPIAPIVDFNGDGKVDGHEVRALAEHWGEQEPSCDISPLPLGDGVVDEQDLAALADYIGADVDDPTLAAHWPMDETEGTVVHDPIGSHDGAVLGLPLWHPTGGMVDGAFEFNGATFVVADSPAESIAGPFSVVAWVKGGAPGQAVLSIQGRATWLYARLGDGGLATDLNESTSMAAPLSSTAAITDGSWHRVALIWDGTDRILAVDGEEVAREPLAELGPSPGKLTVGAGGTLSPATYWTGLIDDVRIYNRAVRP